MPRTSPLGYSDSNSGFITNNIYSHVLDIKTFAKSCLLDDHIDKLRFFFGGGCWVGGNLIILRDISQILIIVTDISQRLQGPQFHLAILEFMSTLHPNV